MTTIDYPEVFMISLEYISVLFENIKKQGSEV